MSEQVLEGTLDRIVFQNATTQWTVARLVPDAGGAEVTVVGALLGVAEGTPLVLRGAWVDDPRFGRQFKVESYKTKSPETRVGIERYLGSGMIPGIGPEIAKRVVAHFGLETLEVIERSPERLSEVEGIGPARAASISKAFAEQRDIQDVIVFLRGHGVSTAFAVRIYKRYGREAVGLIRQNPYRLALEVWGIGFKTADAIAQSLGIDPAAPERMQAGLVHAVEVKTEDGHTHVPEAELVAAAAELLGVGADVLVEPLVRLAATGMVIREELGTSGWCIALPEIHRAEVEAARAVAELAAAPMRAGADPERAIGDFEARAGLTLAEEQKRAIRAGGRDKCVVITGGPGVGKTTIVRAIVALAGASRRSLALAAPTGRAAKRLSETTGAAATTLHRLLEFNPRAGRFERSADNPLDVATVIVDEASMLDLLLFRALLVALPAQAQLILVGDVDQLPSVGPGAVLGDVIASGVATVVRLQEIFRQAAESAIITNAHRINRGAAPDLEAPAGDAPTRSDFYFIERDDPAAARQTVLDLVADRIPSRFGFDPITQIQVLAPMHRGELGTIALNAGLQERLNPIERSPRELRRGNRVFRLGDKVMQIRNDYDKEVFNGDIGVVADVDAEGAKMVVELLEGRRIAYEAGELDELVHAFAVSVHKSQGSEYPAVILPLLTQHYMMLERNLLYTAITRGKKLVVIVGSRRAVAMAVRNNRTRRRWTWLAQRIRDLGDGGRPAQADSQTAE